MCEEPSSPLYLRVVYASRQGAPRGGRRTCLKYGHHYEQVAARPGKRGKASLYGQVPLAHPLCIPKVHAPPPPTKEWAPSARMRDHPGSAPRPASSTHATVVQQLWAVTVAIAAVACGPAGIAAQELCQFDGPPPAFGHAMLPLFALDSNYTVRERVFVGIAVCGRLLRALCVAVAVV